MKKVICGGQLYNSMQESVNLLCDIVKTTLGPKGCNSIIDHSDFTPFITNDGATIAKNIESDDPVINTILEIAKEASLKTNDTVGDGTTTTLVLLQSIFNESLQYIKNGMNPILLKKELHKSLAKIIPELEKQVIKINESHLKKIATIAANDEELGTLVSQVFSKVKEKSAITIEEIEENKLEVSYQTGYTFPITLASPYFFKENSSLENIHILIINDFLDNIEPISSFLNDIITSKKSFVIIANDFDENFVQTIVSLKLTHNLNCYLLKIEEYGMKQRYISKDLEQLTNAKIIEDINKITVENIGFIKNFQITKEQATIQFTKNKQTEQYLKEIVNDELQKKNNLDQEFIEKRIAMFSNGLANIKIGALTKTERREKKMRLEDAIWAIDSAKNGILPGGGIAFLKTSKQINLKNEADQILKNALTKPFEQILLNAGLETNKIKNTLEKKNYQSLFNILTNQFEDIKDTNVIDSFAIIKSTLENATSIATMLLTTTSLIINEREKSLTNSFTEI